MKQYLNLLETIMKDGTTRSDRTGVGTKGIFGYQMRFNLQEGLPILTTKKIHLKSIIWELIWFLRGETNIKFLNDRGVTIWDEWADENGDLGPVYGYQWRHWWAVNKENPMGMEIDQIRNVIEQLKNNPNSRRHIVTAWNPADVDSMALPPCHCLFQFYVSEGKLSCQMYQRSADVFLGVPFNITSYAILTMLIAMEVGLNAGEFIHTLGDAHIYLNHFEQVKLQLSRSPKPLPELVIDKKELTEYTYEDFHLGGYEPWPAIKADIAV